MRRSIEDYRRALSLLGEVVEGEWDGRFPEIEVIALTEANRIATLIERGGGEPVWPMDARLRRLLDGQRPRRPLLQRMWSEAVARCAEPTTKDTKLG